MKNIIFIAPPASGKGTISKTLAEEYGYKHLSTGECLRKRVENNDKEIKYLIENGKLVSDELISTIIGEEISILKGQPFILDGVPRTLIQAKMLDTMFEKNMVTDVIVIKLNINKETAIKRILGRIVCSSCGKSYNMFNEKLKPKNENICDLCNNLLSKRSDDTREKIETRFSEYEKNILPIVEYYKSKNMIIEFNAEGEIEDALNKVKELIND